MEDTDGAINTQHPASPRMGIGFASTNGSADWVAPSDRKQVAAGIAARADNQGQRARSLRGYRRYVL